MQNEIGLNNFFQRRAECRNQLMRQFPDKPDRIGNQNRKILSELNPANQGIESGEQPLGNKCFFLGESAKQRRFTRIGVSHQRYQRQLITTTTLAVQLPVFAHLFDVAPQRTDPMTDLPAVHFEFCFTRTARADTTAETREVFAISGQARQPVLELSKLHLQLAFFGAGTTGKDIENQSRAVDDFSVEDFFQILVLAWREFFVKDNDIHTFQKNLFTQLLDFAFSDVGGRIRTVAALDHLIDDACAG